MKALELTKKKGERFSMRFLQQKQQQINRHCLKNLCI